MCMLWCNKKEGCLIYKNFILDEAEEKKKGDLKAQAKKELDDWYAQREATLKGSREANLFVFYLFCIFD